MTTHEATTRLAEIFLTGDADGRVLRAAERHLWVAVEHADTHDWNLADYALESAYHALGAEPPEATANDLALGRHPIVTLADERWREEMGED